jgi:uncharacterized membrane protein
VERNAISRANNAQAEEERQFKLARGNLSALKKYATDCLVCVFAGEALQAINELESKPAESLFKLEVCSKEYLPVYVGYAGRPDPNSGWVAEGWYKIEMGECRIIATLVKGDFFVSAHNKRTIKRTIWTGEDGDRGYCTLNDAFTLILLPEGRDCSEGETLTKFAKKRFEGNGSKFTWTLAAKPWTYTALAVSNGTTDWGWSGAGHSSSDEAERVALERCNRSVSDCSVRKLVRDDMCLALSVGRSGDGGSSLGWSERENVYEARNDAQNACRDTGARVCRVKSESCSP